MSLDATSCDALRAHRARADERASACGVELPPTAFVFSSEVDGSALWSPDSTSRSFARLCRQTGLAGVRLHDLRHCATRLLTTTSARVDVRTVAGRLGHRNAATTLNVYSHFLAESDRAAADVLGRILDDAVRQGAAVEGGMVGAAVPGRA